MMKGGTPENLYLDLLKKCITDSLADKEYFPAPLPRDFLRHRISRLVVRHLRKKNIRVMREQVIDHAARAEGADWPVRAQTMIGLKRLDHLQQCVETVLKENVPGDLIETGVWRGGTVIFMKAVLKAYGAEDRTVWVADSFEGLPRPNPEKYPMDEGDTFHVHDYLRIPLEEVQENFRRYGLLDEKVRFLKGWFRDTLPEAPVERLAVLRLDGDMYESTTDALTSLYPKLSPGGFVIIDDYFLRPCRQAVADYREAHGITEEIQWIDRMGAFWRRSR